MGRTIPSFRQLLEIEDWIGPHLKNYYQLKKINKHLMKYLKMQNYIHLI